jgi:plastocyanin
MKSKAFLVAVALASVVSTSAAFGISAQAAPNHVISGKAAMPTLTISMFTFSSLSVKAGVRFTVMNKDSTDHTFHVAGTKIDPLIKAGASVQVTAPSKPAKYKVTCDFHPSMHGVLTVTK